MKLLCDNPGYQDMVNPMQELEDLPLVEHSQIPLCFLHVKEDRISALCVMCMPDPNTLFNLKQLVQYALIFGRPEMENIWQGIAVDYAYHMHWHTLFGFALCWTLCTNSAGKTMLVWQLALVMAWPGLYCEVVDTFNKVYEKLFKGQCGAQLSIFQVHIPDDQVQNFSDDDALCILLYNQIPVKWVNHRHTYGVVYLEQQFHHLTMSLDIFQEIDNEWHKMSKEDYYCLLFKHAEEGVAGLFPDNGLYYYIGMDPNVGQLWKQTLVHGTMPSIGAATNIALANFEMVDATAAGGSTTPLRKDSKPLPPVINVATGEEAKMMDTGGSPPGA
ncbi:hypothetical protein C0993_000202 [Termitomyces sp. T159_Od127]|nr:hypothetical protein C0993_000202 [Termitomyces sp. T159_Od127]